MRACCKQALNQVRGPIQRHLLWARKRLRMRRWVGPLLYITADAAAERDWALTARALDAFSAVVTHATSLGARARLSCC